MRFYLFLFLFLLTITFFANAQHPSFEIQKVHDYQSANSITDVQTDKDGFIWIVSFGGIKRFDGNKFKPINSSNTNHGSFLRFYETINKKKYVIDSDSRIYFIEADTIRSYKYNNLLIELNQRNSFLDVYFDRDNQLHMSSKHHGYFIIDNEGNINFPLKDKKVNLFGYACILRENEDEKPFILQKFDERKDGSRKFYYLFDKELNLIDSLEVNKNLFTYHPSIVKKQNGNYLFSSGRGNILEFNKEGFIKEIEYESPVLNLLIDKHEGLWLSTHKGIHYYESSNVEKDKRVVVGNKPISIASTIDYQGGIWFYQANNLKYLFSPNQNSIRKNGGLIHSDRVYDIEIINNKLYALTNSADKISVIDYEKRTLDSINLESLLERKSGRRINAFNSIYYDKKEAKTWIAKRGKIFYSKEGQWKEISTKKVDGTKNTIYRFCKKIYGTNQSIVAGYYENKFFLIEKDSISYTSPAYPKEIIGILIHKDSIFVATSKDLYLQVGEKIVNLSEQYSEKITAIRHMEYFQNRLWCSSSELGVFVLLPEKIKQLRFKGATIMNANFAKSSPTKLWLLSWRGSYLFDSEQGSIFDDNQSIKAFRFMGSNKIIRTDSDKCYLSTANNGICVLSFNRVKKDTLFPPKLIFDQLKIAEKKVTPVESVIKLNYNESFIQIYYVGLNYDKKKLTYRYRMFGLNKDWIETEENYTQFTTLPGGKYSFEIQCKTSNQIWSESKFLHFEIIPPFWRTWWFITLSILFIMFVSFQIFNYRFKIIQKEKTLLLDRLKAEQKALRAQMSPHYLFNIISSVRYIVNKGTSEKANQFLDMFAKSMRNILDQANENNITIENEIRFLKEYIEMELFRLEGKFKYKIHSKQLEDYLNRLIPPFIIQPFVENAIQHGLKNQDNNGLLCLDFKLELPFLIVEIEDNGIGREKANLYRKGKKTNSDQSHGMRIINERLTIHNSKKENIFIKDLFDENKEANGTHVMLYIRIFDKTEEA